MRKNKHLFLCILLFLIFGIFFTQVNAQSPFGGRVLMVRTPPTVQCDKSLVSPFTISPVGGFLPGPWSTLPLSRGYGVVTPGAWIIGTQSLLPGTCVSGVPPAPFPTFSIDLYGTSSAF